MLENYQMFSDRYVFSDRYGFLKYEKIQTILVTLYFFRLQYFSSFGLTENYTTKERISYFH